MKDKDKTKENESLDDDKIDVSKSVFQVNREMHEQKLAELEEKQKELERQAQEREKKKREAYAIVTYIMVSPYLYPGNEQQPHDSL